MSQSAQRIRALAGYLLELFDRSDSREVDPPAITAKESMRRLASAATDDLSAHPSESEIADAMLHASKHPRSLDTKRHILGCRDCGFLASILLAGEQIDRQKQVETEHETSPKVYRGQPAGTTWRGTFRWTAGAAMAVLLVLLGVLLDQRTRNAFEEPATGGATNADVAASVPAIEATVQLDLFASRNGSTPSVAMSDVRGRGLTLFTEARIPEGEAVWLLKANESDIQREVGRGTLRFGAGERPLRRISIHVPWERLEQSGHGRYLLVIERLDGSVVHEWEWLARGE